MPQILHLILHYVRYFVFLFFCRVLINIRHISSMISWKLVETFASDMLFDYKVFTTYLIIVFSCRLLPSLVLRWCCLSSLRLDISALTSLLFRCHCFFRVFFFRRLSPGAYYLLLLRMLLVLRLACLVFRMSSFVWHVSSFVCFLSCLEASCVSSFIFHACNLGCGSLFSLSFAWGMLLAFLRCAMLRVGTCCYLCSFVVLCRRLCLSSFVAPSWREGGDMYVLGDLCQYLVVPFFLSVHMLFWMALLSESPRRKPGWRFTAGVTCTGNENEWARWDYNL